MKIRLQSICCIAAAAALLLQSCGNNISSVEPMPLAGPDGRTAADIRQATPTPEEVDRWVDHNSPAVLGLHKMDPEQGAAMLDSLAAIYSDRESWELRREAIRSDMRKAIGLDRLPQTFDGKVYLGEKREHDGYTVQNLGLEILPGVYSTGALYLPAGKLKRHSCPVVVNPHGHDQRGHAADYVQIRCAMQARMGCIALSTDMFAYGEDSFFDSAWHKSGFAQPLQVLAVLRLIDYGLSMKAADPGRVAVTGCSGGGSVCMFATALDDRITLSMPVVMMSSYFKGGCICESGTQLHNSAGGTGNVEIASIAAPRPMLLISDGADWTAHCPDVDFPFVKRIYGFYGAEDNVENVHFPEGQHNYDADKRQAAYAFLAARFGLDTSSLLASDGSLDESAAIVEDAGTLRIWGPGGFELPEDAVTDPEVLASRLGL